MHFLRTEKNGTKGFFTEERGIFYFDSEVSKTNVGNVELLDETRNQENHALNQHREKLLQLETITNGIENTRRKLEAEIGHTVKLTSKEARWGAGGLGISGGGTGYLGALADPSLITAGVIVGTGALGAAYRYSKAKGNRENRHEASERAIADSIGSRSVRDIMDIAKHYGEETASDITSPSAKKLQASFMLEQAIERLRETLNKERHDKEKLYTLYHEGKGGENFIERTAIWARNKIGSITEGFFGRELFTQWGKVQKRITNMDARFAELKQVKKQLDEEVKHDKETLDFSLQIAADKLLHGNKESLQKKSRDEINELIFRAESMDMLSSEREHLLKALEFLNSDKGQSMSTVQANIDKQKILLEQSQGNEEIKQWFLGEVMEHNIEVGNTYKLSWTNNAKKLVALHDGEFPTALEVTHIPTDASIIDCRDRNTNRRFIFNLQNGLLYMEHKNTTQPIAPLRSLKKSFDVLEEEEILENVLRLPEEVSEFLSDWGEINDDTSPEDAIEFYRGIMEYNTSQNTEENLTSLHFKTNRLGETLIVAKDENDELCFLLKDTSNRSSEYSDMDKEETSEFLETRIEDLKEQTEDTHAKKKPKENKIRERYSAARKKESSKRLQKIQPKDKTDEPIVDKEEVRTPLGSTSTENKQDDIPDLDNSPFSPNDLKEQAGARDIFQECTGKKPMQNISFRLNEIIRTNNIEKNKEGDGTVVAIYDSIFYQTGENDTFMKLVVIKNDDNLYSFALSTANSCPKIEDTIDKKKKEGFTKLLEKKRKNADTIKIKQTQKAELQEENEFASKEENLMQEIAKRKASMIRIKIQSITNKNEIFHADKEYQSSTKEKEMIDILKTMEKTGAYIGYKIRKKKLIEKGEKSSYVLTFIFTPKGAHKKPKESEYIGMKISLSSSLTEELERIEESRKAEIIDEIVRREMERLFKSNNMGNFDEFKKKLGAMSE